MAEDRSIPIRVAAVSIASDPTTLMGLALGDPLRRIRTTAATRLLDGPAGGYRALSLLNSTDVMVHVAVCEYLISHPNPKTEDTLVAILKGSESRDLVRSAAHALARLYQGRRRGNPSLAAIVPGLLAHEDAGIRGGGAALARSLGLSDAAKVDPAAEIPLADVHTIRGAVVETSFGPIVFQLFPEDAPLNVWNFAKLAESGFYDGLSFHRVVPDFVVQGGDPRGDGWGGPGYTIPDEVTQRSHTVGALGMALSGPDTGGSQWYVTLSPQPHLDGQYTIFGQVTQGQHVLQSMLPGDEIRSIRVERVAPLSERRAAERLAGNESYTRLKNNTPPKKRRPRPAATKEIKEDEDLAVDPDLDDAPDYLAPKEKDAPLIQTERVEFDAEDEQEAPAEEDTDEDSTDEDTDPDDD
jgi:peptidyl-prolyl cis-trans isomerase B (cyclophilin B)